MGRRKKGIRLPFFTLRINKGTILNIFGFLFIGTAIIVGFALFKHFTSVEDEGRMLTKVALYVMSKVGGLAVLLPLMLLLFSGHFFKWES
jgi:S-DNA-T family DNA segregation ATPase FtsK/SpoIIIE